MTSVGIMTAPKQTRVIAATAAGPVDAASSFVELDVDLAEPDPHDLVVDVRAVSVNPVDVKVRGRFPQDQAPKVLGYDASGVVVAVGSAVTRFEVDDEVYYAGSIGRSGSNADYQLVDERITGHKPAALDFAEAAALPLTTITAWESLFEQFRLTAESTGTLLVVAGAGGVGSMAIQLARQLTDVTVIATASRPESVAWARELGAHHVVDHHRLASDIVGVAPRGVNWILSPFSAGNVETYAQIMAVRGEVVAIDEPPGLDIVALKARSQTWHWELMFTRPMHDRENPAQHELLDAAARMFDDGTLRSTMRVRLSPITPENLREAHRRVEGSAMIGKVVVSAE